MKVYKPMEAACLKAMPFDKGSLILANYTAKVKDTGEPIETTLEEEAKKLKIYDAAHRYEPRLIAVGEGWVISGLDDAIKEMSVGDRKEVEVAPEKAFGLRDPSQTRMVPIRKFGEKAGDLAVGDSVEIDNREGIVRFVGSGRAQVDFNHRLAGKSIVYDFEVVRALTTEDEKIRGLIDRRFAGEGGKVTFVRADPGLTVQIPEELFLAEGLQIIKRGISNDFFKFVPSVTTVMFVEEYKSKKAEAPPSATEQKPAEEQPKPAEQEAPKAA